MTSSVTSVTSRTTAVTSPDTGDEAVQMLRTIQEVTDVDTHARSEMFLLRHLNHMLVHKPQSVPRDVLVEIFTNFKNQRQDFGGKKISYDRPYPKQKS